jgi:glycosyltransferase involved in cell wall biosynthesis
MCAAPRVTVAIPTFNRAHLLRTTIGTVLAQTYTGFDLLVCDNASTDHTADIIAELNDARIRYIKRSENIGLFANYNDIIERAANEFILLLADDDLLEPGFLEETIRAMDDDPDVGVVHTGFYVVGPTGDVLSAGNWTCGLTANAVEPAALFLRESMRWSCRICPSTALIRTAAIPKGGMRLDDMPAIDFGLWLRLAGAGWTFAFLAKPLGSYRVHPDSHSALRYGVLNAEAYEPGFDTANRLYALKCRFLSETASLLADSVALRRLARWGLRRETIVAVRRVTLDRAGTRFRRPRFLIQVLVADPGLAVSGLLWRSLIVDVLRTLGLRRVKQADAV